MGAGSEGRVSSQATVLSSFERSNKMLAQLTLILGLLAGGLYCLGALLFAAIVTEPGLPELVPLFGAVFVFVVAGLPGSAAFVLGITAFVRAGTGPWSGRGICLAGTATGVWAMQLTGLYLLGL